MKIIFLLLAPLFLFGNILWDRMSHASPGDYIVTEQGKTTSLIRVHSLKENVLILEEVSLPSHLTQPILGDWQKWLLNHAPGHTSWVMYSIDLTEKKLLECYSFSRSAWLQIAQQDHFITALFQLPFTKVPSDLRKKIGPPPFDDSPDLRPLWQPPMMVHGKALNNPDFNVYQTTWPKDSSELSQKSIELYFAKPEKYPFPFWIQVHGDHISVFAKVIDSGHSLESFYQDFPKK